MKVSTRATFFFGKLKPATLYLRVRYFSTSFMKVSAFSLCPLKRGGSFHIALMLAADAIGCSCAGAPAAGPPPPGGPPSLGGPSGPPPIPSPCSPIATLRSSSNSGLVRGC